MSDIDIDALRERDTLPPVTERDDAAKFASIVGHMLDDKLRPVLANQDLTLAEVRELSSRVGTIEKRMHIGEGRFERIESEIKELRDKIGEQEARILVLEKVLTDDGKTTYG